MIRLLSIGAAGLSYRYFERPFLKLKERFTFGRSDGPDRSSVGVTECARGDLCAEVSL